MNNTTTKTFGRNFDFGKNFFATSFDEEKKTGSSFYDDYVKRSNKTREQNATKNLAKIPVPVSLSSSPKIPNTFEEITESSGSEIKKNIESVLTKKYGALDVAHTFDSIPDKDIEANIKVAQNTVQTNVDRGILDENFSAKLPNLVSGLALSFAAAEKGNSKAAKRAREAAYTESDSKSCVIRPSVSSLVDYDVGGPKVQKLPLAKPFDNQRDVLKLSQQSSPISMVKEPKDSGESNKDKYSLWENTPFETKEIPIKTDETKNVANNNWNTFESSKEDELNTPYAKNQSSTLQKYDFNNTEIEELLSLDHLDAIDSFKKGDFISGIVDIWRNFPTAGIFPKQVKDISKFVWKMGSEFYLRPRDCNISADMLEHSLQEKPEDVVFYDDSDVAKKIKATPKFLSKIDSMAEDIQNKILQMGEKTGLSFETNDDQDLYYSIHGCQIAIDNISYNEDGTKDISVHISDNYDYTEIWTAMEGKELNPLRISLGTLANDLGTITSKFDAINPYKVDIYFTIRR